MSGMREMKTEAETLEAEFTSNRSLGPAVCGMSAARWGGQGCFEGTFLPAAAGHHATGRPYCSPEALARRRWQQEKTRPP